MLRVNIHLLYCCTGVAFVLMFLNLYFLSSSDSNCSRIFPCNDIQPKKHLAQRGKYWVFYNFITPVRRFRCDESITYTTQADYTYLDNLAPILLRWQGPVSIALHAPGMDFNATIRQIRYHRQCTPLVKEFVTFHLFFERKYIPQYIQQLRKYSETKPKVDCKFEVGVGVGGGTAVETWRRKQNLMYPINVARNIAREMATTHFVLASDIELYPSPNLIPKFLGMIQRQKLLRGKKPKVFVLSVFEVEANVTSLPEDKNELKKMLENKSAVPFHEYICKICHEIPREKDWQTAHVNPGLSVFNIAKRERPFHHWEPFYIGTKWEPIFDERISWEMMRNKMTHAFLLCLLDYEFHVLDNAFLVHRPGIKRISKWSGNIAKEQNLIIQNTIIPQLSWLYGYRQGCL